MNDKKCQEKGIGYHIIINDMQDSEWLNQAFF